MVPQEVRSTDLAFLKVLKELKLLSPKLQSLTEFCVNRSGTHAVLAGASRQVGDRTDICIHQIITVFESFVLSCSGITLRDSATCGAGYSSTRQAQQQVQ